MGVATSTGSLPPNFFGGSQPGMGPDGVTYNPGEVYLDPTTGAALLYTGTTWRPLGRMDPTLPRDRLNAQISQSAQKLGLGYAKLSQNEQIAAERVAGQTNIANIRSTDARAADLRSLLQSRMTDSVSLANAYDTAAKNAADFAANPRDAYASLLYRNTMFGRQGATPFGSTGSSDFGQYGSALQQDYNQMFSGAQDALSRASGFVNAPPPAQYYPHGVYPEDLQRLGDAMRQQQQQGLSPQQIQDNMNRWFGVAGSASASAAAPAAAAPALGFGAAASSPPVSAGGAAGSPPAVGAPDGLAAALQAIAASPFRDWLEQNAAAINNPPPQTINGSPTQTSGVGGPLPANAAGGATKTAYATGGSAKVLAAHGAHISAIARHMDAGEKRKQAALKLQEAMAPPPQPMAPPPGLSFAPQGAAKPYASGGQTGQTGPQTLLDYRKQNSQVLPEPAVIMGAQSGRIYGTAAENGPEREASTGDGSGFRFTPEPGVSQTATPQRQDQIIDEARSVPPQPIGAGGPVSTGPTLRPVAGSPATGAPAPGVGLNQLGDIMSRYNNGTNILDLAKWVRQYGSQYNPQALAELGPMFGNYNQPGGSNILSLAAWAKKWGPGAFQQPMTGVPPPVAGAPPGAVPPTGVTTNAAASPQLSFGVPAFAGGGDLASALQAIAASPDRQFLQDNAAAINAGTASEFAPNGSVTMYGQTYNPDPGESAADFQARMAPTYAQSQTDALRAQAPAYTPVRWMPGLGAVNTGYSRSSGPGAPNAAETATLDKEAGGTYVPGTGLVMGNQGAASGTPGGATSSSNATPADMNSQVNTYIANQLKLQGTTPTLAPGQTLYDPRYLAPIWQQLKNGDPDMLKTIYSAYSSIGISPQQLDGLMYNATPQGYRAPQLSFG